MKRKTQKWAGIKRKEKLCRGFEKRHTECGNVLFLILIAVALFAALSYAVTSSTRSGGGDAGRETNLIKTAQITQYPASIRTSIVRMVISNGTDVTGLDFTAPSDTDFATNCATPTDCVFHPSGGGATYQNAPAEAMDPSGANPTGLWFFSADYEITNIGLSTASSPDGNDIIAFLPGLRQSICQRLNEELGISGSNTVASYAITVQSTTAQHMQGSYTIPSTEIYIGTDDNSSASDLDGQAFGCITDSNGQYVYYHALVER